MQAPSNWRELEIENGRSPRLASIAPSVSEFAVSIETPEPGFDWRSMRDAQERETLANASALKREIEELQRMGILQANESHGRKYTY